jgi:hypothetical protein
MIRGGPHGLGGFIVVAAIVALAILAFRRHPGHGPGGQGGPYGHGHGGPAEPGCGPREDEAVAILRRGFAEGRLTEEEYRTRLAALGR